MCENQEINGVLSQHSFGYQSLSAHRVWGMSVIFLPWENNLNKAMIFN